MHDLKQAARVARIEAERESRERNAEIDRLRAALAETVACLDDVYPILGQIEWRLGAFERVRTDLGDLPARTKAALAKAKAMQEGGQ